jgi:uncharacterized membrane protein YfcA
MIQGTDYSVAALALIALAFLLAGVVKGVLGMGLPTVAMALLGLVMAPAQAAALLVIPSLATNLWQLAAGPGMRATVKRFASMMLTIALGTFLGIAMLAGATSAATAALGAVLALYGVSGLISLRFRVPPRHEPWLSPVIGFLTGILTGATGVFVIPAVPYFASLELEKEELLQTLGLAFTVSTLSLAAGLMYAGHFNAGAGTASLLALAPAAAGMFLGQLIRSRLSPEAFRRCFFAALIPLGGYMVIRAIA